MKENNNKKNDIDYLIRQAYNQDNTEADRERYKENAIKAILGTYYNDLCKKALQLINRYKGLLTTQVGRKDALYGKNVHIEPKEIVHDFIINKLYEKDALNNYVNSDFVYKNIIQFLFPVLEYYFKDAYNIRNQKQGDWQKKDIIEDNLDINNVIDEDKNEKNMEMELEEELKEEYQKKPAQLSEEFNIGVLDTKKGKEKFIDGWHVAPKNMKDAEDKEELSGYQKKLDELSEKYSLEVKLLLELSKKDLIHIKDPSELYTEYIRGEKSKKKFYPKKGAYIEIVKEEGQFHYTNILKNHGEGLEKLVLPDGKIYFGLSEEKMIIRATDFLKQRMHRFFEIIEKEKNLF